MTGSKPALLTIAAVTAVGLTVGCAANVGTKAAAKPLATTTGSTTTLSADKIRLGYFANITHAIPVIAVQRGTFQQHLGSTQVETQVFNAGPAAVEALFGGTLDATYIGPNPAINAFAKSKGAAIRIVAGATTGGASLVVQSDAGIETVADLKGKTIATPQKGGTQDVALRAYLTENGIRVGGGKDDVNVLNTENATTLEQFKSKTIAGGWLPEPWVSRLVLEGAGKVLVDEKTRWADG
ncbi:MAG: ABC transporter substrate-binding protein, partial [Mycobacteriales bacterium]